MQVADQLQRIVHIPEKPERIVSLVPSQTELLCSLGLESRLAGITKFCVHPREVFQSKTKVGGTKNIDHDKINSIAPDLIIANKEENQPGDIEMLEKRFPVWVSDVKDLGSAIDMISAIGTITDKHTESQQLIETIVAGFSNFEKGNPLKVIYLIWNQPYMTIGSDTFIHDMISRCGWQNAFSDRLRYPVLGDDDIISSGADLILLSSEPYPFSQKHADEISVKFNIPALVVDGEYFSWYGSRLTGTPNYLQDLIQRAGNVLRLKTAGS